MPRLRVTRKGFKFATLDGTRYMIPDFTGQPEFTFNRLELSVEDCRNRTLKRLGDIVCYRVNVLPPPARHRGIIVALYREGVNKPTAVERMNDAESLAYWHLLWENVRKSVVVPGRHFLLFANMKPEAGIAGQFERIEGCYIYRFIINEV